MNQFEDPTSSVTPTVTASPTVATSQTPVATPATGTNGTTNDSSGSNGSHTTLLIVLIAIAVILLICGVIITLMVWPRQGTGPGSPRGLPGPGQFGNAPRGGFTNVQQSWQENQSMYAGFNTFSQNHSVPQQGHLSNDMTPGNCMHCGAPLEPNAIICGNCGLHHTSVSYPNGPTRAY